MIDWEAVQKDIAEMRHYFSECAKNADPKSEAHDKFVGYVCTLVNLAELIREWVQEEQEAADKPVYGSATDWEGVRCE